MQENRSSFALPDSSDRTCGVLVGLACGDAVGTTSEFQRKGSFPEIRGMVGGGVFNLKPGQWTDDTSLALCLAQSLIERAGHDPRDQLERYLGWHDEGRLSSNGRCFDVGNSTTYSLEKFRCVTWGKGWVLRKHCRGKCERGTYCGSSCMKFNYADQRQSALPRN